MTIQIPTVEPAELIVGDTWTWQKTLADYPANASPAWTLTYYFRGVGGEFSAAAAASGADHLVTVAKATSATYKAGRYGWTSVVTDGTSRYTVGTGSTVVKPDPSKTGAGQDTRSHARKVLDAIEAVLEGRATKDQEEYTIGTRSLKRTPLEDLYKLRARYRNEVAGEDAQDRLATGQAGGSRLLARL